MKLSRLDFQPPRLLRDGHTQTLLGTMMKSEPFPEDTRHEVQLEDGDRILLFENRPLENQTNGRSALLLHGLGGCHQSGYMMRTARRLRDRGIRTFRLTMRGVSDGAELARHPMHAGRWQDVAASLKKIQQVVPDSPTTMIGFSLGANVALLSLGRAAADGVDLANCDSCIAVAPPADLSSGCRWLQQGLRRYYDKYILRFLLDHLNHWWSMNPHARRVDLPRRPRSIYEFDQLVTAPLGGFRDVEHYYSESSCGPELINVRLPTRILAAENDPMIPIDLIRKYERSPHVQLFETTSGGHLGFVARRSQCEDRRYLDQVLTDWTCDESDWM